jgi:hypothetical protein
VSEWKAKRGDQEWAVGGIEEIRAAAKAGRAFPDDYIFNPVLNQWMYAKDLAELSDAFGALGTKCPNCGKFAVKKVEGLQGDENLFGLVLVAFLLIPAVIYYWDKTRHPYCTACKKRVPSA